MLGLVVVNVIGTVWGVAWYWEQLRETPWYFLPVVPDSPLHALMFGTFIFWLLKGERYAQSWRRFVAWAGVLGGIKYGLWTTVVLSQYLLLPGTYSTFEDWMLYASHGGMALQGLVYMNRLPKTAMVAAVAIFWLALNDFCDYIFMTHPRLPLPDEVTAAGWTAILLTALVAVLAARQLQPEKAAG